jgi:hypothetical protein
VHAGEPAAELGGVLAGRFGGFDPRFDEQPVVRVQR